MPIDLISRIIYLASKGDNEHADRVAKWLTEAESAPRSEFFVGEEKYYWKIISSVEFKDIIDEDFTDWFLIYSEDGGFKAIGKVMSYFKNLIGENTEYHLATLWLLKSNIDSVKVVELPLYIACPYVPYQRPDRLNYYFKQVLLKLRDPKIQLTESCESRVNRGLLGK